MDGGISIELVETPAGAGRRRVYELAEAQFGRYRPPTHRYLLLDRDPGEADWIPISDRIGEPTTDPGCRALLPTFTRPHVGRMQELDRWYTEHHVPAVTSVDGFAAGQRFAHRDPSAEHPRLALYELDAEDLDAALRRLTDALPAMVQTDALDGLSIASWLYIALPR